MTKNIQGEEQQEEVMLMQVTVNNNATVVTVRLLFLDEVNVIRWGRFQTTALLTANGFDTPVHHSPFGGCLLFTHIHMYSHCEFPSFVIWTFQCGYFPSGVLFSLNDRELWAIHPWSTQSSLNYLLKGQSFLLFWKWIFTLMSFQIWIYSE